MDVYIYGEGKSERKREREENIKWWKILIGNRFSTNGETLASYNEPSRQP